MQEEEEGGTSKGGGRGEGEQRIAITPITAIIAAVVVVIADCHRHHRRPCTRVQACLRGVGCAYGKQQMDGRELAGAERPIVVEND